MEKFEELFNLVLKDRKYSSWSKEKTFKSRFLELSGEIEEIGLALENNDMINLKEEIGDSLWDLLCLVAISQEKELFDLDDVLTGIYEKLKRRKKWIFENNIPNLTKEEELEIWNLAKKKEKTTNHAIFHHKS